MSVKLLAEHHLEFLNFKVAGQARLSLQMSKYHIVGNHMSRLKFLKSWTQDTRFLRLQIINDFKFKWSIVFLIVKMEIRKMKIRKAEKICLI